MKRLWVRQKTLKRFCEHILKAKNRTFFNDGKSDSLASNFLAFCTTKTLEIKTMASTQVDGGG